MSNTHLDDESRKAIVSYKFQRAEETLSDARLLFDSGRYNSAANRLYYACYYAVEASLINISVSASTHAGVKQMFGLKFIVGKKIDVKWGKFYSDLFNIRQDGDYGDFEYYSKDDIEPLLSKAEDFIQLLKKI